MITNPFHSAALLPHHVGVSSARHALTGVEVEELVDLWGGQSVSNFQLLHDEHLPGEGLLATRTDPQSRCDGPLPILPNSCHRIGLMLERHLENKTDDVKICPTGGHAAFYKVSLMFLKLRRGAQVFGDFVEKFYKKTTGHTSSLPRARWEVT